MVIEKEKYRLLVAGPRKGIEESFVFEKLDNLFDLLESQLENKELVIIEGGARGVDRHARNWAIARSITFKTYEADWDDLTAEPCLVKVNRAGFQYNALAGLNRNATMGELCDRGVIFLDGKSTGTRDMYKRLLSYKEKGDHGKVCATFINGIEVYHF